MRTHRGGRSAFFSATLFLSGAIHSAVYGQQYPITVHDWTIGPRPYQVGLTEYTGDFVGTRVSWGFGGMWTSYKAPAIALGGGGTLATLFAVGGLSFATICRRSNRKPDSSDS